MNKKSLLFINGNPPENLPNLEGYDLIATTDGAFHYLKEKNFPLQKLDFISGDFDSHVHDEETLLHAQLNNIEVIITPNQDFTDFHKSLNILLEKGVTEVVVYGASGGEQDHFLGNLHVAFLFKNKIKITFFDENSVYFFCQNSTILQNVKGKMISIVPFPLVNNITTTGLKWELNMETLSLTTKMSTRNLAIKKNVKINYILGDIVVFIEK